MAITQTGSDYRVGDSSGANSGTLSSTLTVPADTTKVVVGISAFQGTSGGLAAMTFTKGGVDTAMTKIAADASTATWQGAVFYLDDPDIGSNKTLKWDWAGSGSSADNTLLSSITYWGGTAASLRDSDSQQGGGVNHVTPTLTAQSGDKIAVFAFGFTNGLEGTIDTWTNSTLLTQVAVFGVGDCAWATADPSGDQTVGWTAATNYTEGGVVGAVMTPSTPPAGPVVAWITA